MDKNSLAFEAKEDGKLADLVKKAFPGLSNRELKKYFSGQLFVDGTSVRTVAGTVKAGQKVELRLGTPLNKENKGIVEGPFKIYFEDDYYIVVHKPAGLLSGFQGAKDGKSCQAILNDVLADMDKPYRFHLVHRLDRETEGLLLLAKSQEAKDKLKNSWEKVEKHYFALLEGTPEKGRGIVHVFIKEGPKQKMEVCKQSNFNAIESISEYEVVEEIGKYTLVKVKLITGKKNQIRVHMSYLKCPIVGDWKYGADSTYKRQLRLLSSHMGFEHPYTKKRFDFSIKPGTKFLNPQNHDERYKKGI